MNKKLADRASFFILGKSAVVFNRDLHLFADLHFTIA